MAKNKLNNETPVLTTGDVLDLHPAYIMTHYPLNASRDEDEVYTRDSLADIVMPLATRIIGWDTSYNIHVMPELPDSDIKDAMPSFEDEQKRRQGVLDSLKKAAETSETANAEYRALSNQWCVKGDGVATRPIVINNDGTRRLSALQYANEQRYKSGLPMILAIPVRVVSYATELDRIEANAAENTVGTSGRKDIGEKGKMALAYRMSCNPNVKPVNFRPAKDEKGNAQESVFGSKGQCYEYIMRVYKHVKPADFGTTNVALYKRFTLDKTHPSYLDWKKFNATNLGALVKMMAALSPGQVEDEMQKIHRSGTVKVKSSRLSDETVEGLTKIDNGFSNRVLTSVTNGDSSIGIYLEATKHAGNFVHGCFVIGQMQRLNALAIALEKIIPNEKAFNALMEDIKALKV